MIKTDATQKAIVAALRAAGASVEHIASATGRAGIPDLLVGVRGTNYLLEVKVLQGKRDPQPASLSLRQAVWHANWRGDLPAVVATPEAALQAVRLSVQPAPRGP